MGDNPPPGASATPTPQQAPAGFGGTQIILGGGSSGFSFGETAALEALKSLYDIQLRATPTFSSSSSVNQSLLDPRSLELQALQISQQHFIDLQNLDLARDKQRLAERQGKHQIALESASLVEQIKSRMQQRELQISQMRQSAEQFQQSMQFQGQQAGLDRALKIMDLTEQARQFNTEQRRQVQNDIAQLSANPGDIVKAEALKQQAGGGSPISTAIAQGGNAITDESLKPLTELLNLRDSLSGQAQQPGQVFNGGVATGDTPQDPAAAAARQAANLNNVLGQVLQGNQNQPLAGSPIATALEGIAGTPGSAVQNNGGIFSAAPGTPGSQQGFQGAMAAPSAEEQALIDEMARMTGLSFGERGGVFSGPVVTGDSSTGRENQEMVMSASPIVVMPIPNDSMGKAPHAQTGGVFSGSTDPANEKARQFIAQALARIFERFRNQGLNFGNQPTPIGVSAPGTSAGIQQLSAGVSAAQTGFDPNSFLNEANALRPVGIGQGIFGRR